ncbi:rhamnulokinase [Dactylosporangium aurantiacum]|uniref:Rhamnulokinase n=1 Tax=Dactylosporangium aurantiacum TaxID=35754 RepID=A0A9Q9MEB8_9ACTN|nr:rhamnulokinase family protein [Dactylosporangium aurantiacum]MDG6102654.1 rhamnulokinase [Dactylosporangium aurantiacum]UWZ53094.1 rhamnulokinase [Dactylosporangium aurantiacum]
MSARAAAGAGPGASPGPVTVAAVDLGASSGRVIVGSVGSGTVRLTEAARFANTPVRVQGTLHWDILALYQGILDGLRAAARHGALASVGVDSWAVDYGLLDGDGRLLANPVHYRDARTADVAAPVPAAALYAATGIAHQPFNTVYQLLAAAGTAQLAAARTLLLIPDLVTYWLTGTTGAERTNASTTGLLTAGGAGWDLPLVSRLGIRASLLPPLRDPGTVAGPLLPGTVTGLTPDTLVTTVASHDTASAVVGVPARGPAFAYISCGTWSLVGMELAAPVLTERSRSAGFTNEAGVDGTVRYLRNVMGLWLLQECMRSWSAAASGPASGPAFGAFSGGGAAGASLDVLLAGAAAAPALRSVVDATDPRFLAPGDMPARIAAALRDTGQPVPDDPPATTRCILDSLALAYRRAVHDVQELTGRHVDVVHLVGGGAQNALLCQLTADACELPVEAGPVEAGALGNVLVQARALGLVEPDLAAMRALVHASRTYRPRPGSAADWSAADRRLPRPAR